MKVTKKFKTFQRILSLIFIFNMIILVSNKNYTELDLKLKLSLEDNDLPLYFETFDACGYWVPSLFSPISLINDKIDVGNYTYKLVSVKIQNPASIKHKNRELEMLVYTGNISNYEKVYLAKSTETWPTNCQFALGYSDIFPNDIGKNYNSIKNLISENKIEKFIFSFGIWKETDNEINSKLYIGESHENFLEKNVGTCNNTNGSYWGCNFDEFTFMNETIPLINNASNNSYNIYFSSEFTKIYFPESFKEKFEKVCTLKKTLVELLICNTDTKEKYLPMKLRNDNMNITIEVDYIKRYYDYSEEGNVTNIFFHKEDYIIFPLSMFKNFHVQFDLDKNLISFFSNDTTLLEVKKEIIIPNNTDNPPKSDDTEPPKGISSGVIIIIIIVVVIVVGLALFFLIKYTKCCNRSGYNKLAEDINKDDKLNDINMNSNDD